MVISGGNFKPDTLKPKEVVSLLLDDEEIEAKCEYLYLIFIWALIDLLAIFYNFIYYIVTTCLKLLKCEWVKWIAKDIIKQVTL